MQEHNSQIPSFLSQLGKVEREGMSPNVRPARVDGSVEGDGDGSAAVTAIAERRSAVTGIYYTCSTA